MTKRIRLLFLIAWSISLALSLTLSIAPPVYADDGNTNSCQIQPMAVDRSPTMNNIRLDTQITANISPDKTFVGLHRWTTGQWPGVDYLVNTTVAFKNGGVVALIAYDSQGGGNSIYIDGIGACKGWRQFFGHLSYDPKTRFKVGQVVSSSDVIGEPGCSGFESYCATNGGSIPAHNHVTLGYWSNIFNFSDGTVPSYAGGYWWIHPTRVETTGTPASDENSKPNPSPEIKPSPTDFVPDYSVQETFAPNLNTGILDNIVVTFAPFRTWVIIGCTLLAIFWIGGLIYSTQFRQSMVVFAVLAILVVAGFIGINKVQASSPVFSPPRNAGYTLEESPGGFVVDVAPNTSPDKAPENSSSGKTSSDGSCSLPTRYPESIRQWCSIIERWGSKRGMDSKMIAAVMLQESGGDPQILSGSGAVGLLQVMPRDGIAATFHNSQGVPYFADRPSIQELKDPDFNVEYGSGMLSDLGINSNPREALLKYGPDPKYLERTYGSRYYYADLVLSIYQNYR